VTITRQLVILEVVILGLCVGSFLNVVIWRVPRGLSVARPPSHCPGCERPIRWRQNVPVLSWVSLRGRCAGCREPIPVRYPLVELAAGALCGLVAVARPGWEVVPYALAALGMLALSVVDVEHHRLPDGVLGPTVVLTAAAFAIGALATGQGTPLGRALLGAVIGLVALGLLHAAQPNGMGFGDVKLAGLCGLLLGWRGLGFVAIGLFGAFVLGSIVGVALMAGGRVGRRARVPFGPFLCASALAVALAGGPLVAATAGALRL
jgi:leader peptidase (prepilin peptidase)/N-methyltransferase